jgi:hypothetical protein
MYDAIRRAQHFVSKQNYLKTIDQYNFISNHKAMIYTQYIVAVMSCQLYAWSCMHYIYIYP